MRQLLEKIGPTVRDMFRGLVLAAAFMALAFVLGAMLSHLVGLSPLVVWFICGGLYADFSRWCGL